MTDERRALPRTTLLTAGVLRLDDGGTVDCMMRNASVSGALIEVKATEGLPPTFRLLFAGQELRCTTVRRTPHALGVAFAI